MRWLAKIIVAIIANAVGLWLANAYIPGFAISGGVKQVLGLALILAVLNFLLKPILKAILGPIIVLTLGLGLIAVNAIILYILDLLSQNLTIQSIPALVWSGVLIGVINFVFHAAAK